MSAKRSKARKARRVRKFKPVEIDGHVLNEEQYKRYLSLLETRRLSGSEEHALGDLLAEYQPSRLAEKALGPLFRRIMGVNLALEHVAQYPFYQSKSTVRIIGADLLTKLGAELNYAASVVQHVAKGIEQEAVTHLQDWQAWTDELQRMECNMNGKLAAISLPAALRDGAA